MVVTNEEMIAPTSNYNIESDGNHEHDVSEQYYNSGRVVDTAADNGDDDEPSTSSNEIDFDKFNISILSMLGVDNYVFHRLYNDIIEREVYTRRLCNSDTVFVQARNPGLNALKALLRGLRSFFRVAGKAEDVKALVSSTKTGIGVFDSIMHGAKISEHSVTKLAKIGDLSLGATETLIKRGDLNRLAKGTGFSGSIAESESKAFGRLVESYPDSTLKNIDDLSSIGKSTYPEFNVTSSTLGKISKSTASKLGKIGKWAWKKLSPGKLLAIGGIVAGALWYKQALEERRGCWLLRKINGKTTSCKLTMLSCASPGEKFMCDTGESTRYTSGTNVPLGFMQVVEEMGPTADALSKELNVSAADLKSQFGELLKKQFTVIETFMKKQNYIIKKENMCKLKNEQWEDNTVPHCRACDTTADPTSTTYRYSDEVPDNYTFSCVVDPNLSDVLGDMSQTIGENVYKVVSGLVKPFVKVFILIIAIVIFALIIFAVVKTIARKRTEYARVS